MNVNWSETMTGKKKPASGLMIPAMVAALLMAAALIGCNNEVVSAHENVSGLPVHAEAVGQDNGSITDTLPTVSEYERLERQAPTAVNRTPRVEARYVSSER